MSPNHDLRTERGLSAYLASQSISHTSATLLTGGTANYVYRVTYPSGQTTIYKHAAPYLHSNTSFAFDPSRMDYEDRILELLPLLLKNKLLDSSVHAVGVKSYDCDKKLLGIEDGGKRHLKDAYTDPALDVPSVGASLGAWLATLHASTVLTPLSLDFNSQDLEENNKVAVNVYRHSYKNLSTAFADFTDLSNGDIELAQQINDEYGSRLEHDNECICHGDFWPGNVMVKPHSVSSETKEEERQGRVDLTVVDWEMTRRGTSATDLAQFCAESFLLDRFCGNRGLLPAVLNAYLSHRLSLSSALPFPDKEWFRRLAIHWGVHVAFWPTRVEWTDRAGTQDLVAIGKEVLKAATESKWDVLFGSTSEGYVDVPCVGLPVFRGLEERFTPEF
ncbi:uncharacterized protein N0V89_005547 [Didymosphaeria variabile]|uniref:Aminoglycoside phosphotransferase domain-containing protein n=1 Tax=Didymosphaeria variabile TaxID=1932322 RepID=A0A9W8XKY9_9PLEO|nr:uncharacterized protein N0V89_005547 [Didymosphaeria variabile]KAJ4353817.1 hypothetical protein N0V89_005547 [Didymosphaeria variabile]